MSTVHWAHTSDFAFIAALLEFGEDYSPRVGDLLEFEDVECDDPAAFEAVQGEVVEVRGEGEEAIAIVRDPATGSLGETSLDAWPQVIGSPTITGLWEEHLRRPGPDGIAFADGLVPPELLAQLRADVDRLAEVEPVDYHPGSEARVRDLVHPSLYPYVEGRSTLRGERPPSGPAPDYDRFGRPYEASAYQWLPTPFAIDAEGQARALAPIHNLDHDRHPAVYRGLEALLGVALPLFESVVGYVEGTTFWREELPGIEHEGELPEQASRAAKPATPTALRGRELLVIPKIVEYRLAAGETHEGVWHVEGMSHERIIATALLILDRDPALVGGELRFKRPYTVEEAGQLFWQIDQCRPRPVEALVDEAAIPVGSVATPEGRLIVFPNSHIHKLSALSVAEGAAEARRRVIVFWLVDPAAQVLSTREVEPLQGSIAHDEALEIRLALMEERRRHKQSHNLRTVSLCEH